MNTRNNSNFRKNDYPFLSIMLGTVLFLSACNTNQYKGLKPSGDSVNVISKEKFGEIERETKTEARQEDLSDILVKYQSLDRTILESNFAKIRGNDVYFYSDSQQNIVLIKELTPMPRGNFMVSEYLFAEDKVVYKHDIDLRSDYVPVETFYVDNKVVRYNVGGEERNCRVNCVLGNNSTPYEYLKYYYDNTQGD